MQTTELSETWICKIIYDLRKVWVMISTLFDSEISFRLLKIDKILINH
jgi:hypothetical protein